MAPGGLAEEGGKVATGLIDALRQQPTMLVMVILNGALIALLWYIAYGQGEFRKQEMSMIFQAQKEVQEILAKCIVPNRTSFGKSEDHDGADTDPPKPLPVPDPRKEPHP